ncbi:hypothetical protein J2Y45_003114 [Dyadobacter sp. BE34]|uniref:Uncharacterized protein n=1 Tax=Dyadobacter fermentans TaxID=94254 RepID=A0ABU1QTY3_9BACT|nr:hypothetical protein [Dyadobacter fermentans]MDR7043663.1 hypothetical protein [Dyadobacter sp. BE242]MDR7197975.1 hypothetical protein [Dyadobacter sp. BE34]MDR7214591.1 hypothetical protein [Dyadobacter sp. BE31]MDR7262126.1 hypothetical protein [Dyadobacter sp. BE32]
MKLLKRKKLPMKRYLEIDGQTASKKTATVLR